MPGGLSIDADRNVLYVHGEWTDSSGDESVEVEDPSTREWVATVPAGVESDVDAAYEAAAAAQAEWADRPPAERSRVVQRVASALDERREDLIRLLADEAGGTRLKGDIEVDIARGITGEAATFPTRMKGQHAQSNVPGKENVVERRPKGVVTVISPWNFSLNLSIRAVAPAVALGNSVVLKPASDTPVTGGLLLAQLFEGADLPDGVLNVVTGRGSEIGDRVAGHPESDVVAFTGSTPIGRQVAATAAENLATPAMELSDVDEGVEIANDTEYGLSVSVHAGDLQTDREIADRIETGMIHVNDQPINDEPHVPFGGVGASGMGRYNDGAILDEFTETKWISFQREERAYPF